MTKHPQRLEHEERHDQDEDDLRSPISSAAGSAPAIAAPDASTPAASVSTVSAMSAVSASDAASASAAVHHDEVARVPSRRCAEATYGFPEIDHGGIQTARACVL